MTTAACLRTLDLQYPDDSNQAMPLENLVAAYLNETSLDTRLIEKILAWHEGPSLPFEQCSPWELIEHWRGLLTVSLIVREKNLLSSYRQLLCKRMHSLHQMVLWSEFQLLSAYQVLVGFLLEESLPKELFLSQLPSGACSVEAGGHWSWGDIPHPLFHAELGVLWCLYASLKGDARFQRAAEKLAEWQQNTLDHDFWPFMGLFSHEGDASELSLLFSNYVLFNAVGRLLNRSDMTFISEKQHTYISTLVKEGGTPSLHLMTLAAWFEHHLPLVTAQPLELPPTFEDTYLALAGSRSKRNSGVATLFGGNTGMGCFHRGNLHVVNFGPQHLPLGDCRGFGLEGTGPLLGARVEAVKAIEGSFLLQGVARMAARPKEGQSSAVFRQGNPGGCWIDTKVVFENGCMNIEVVFNGIFEQKDFAFVFFVKAPGCLVDGQKNIKPRSFQHYQDKIQPVQFNGQQVQLTITAQHQEGEMHVIPLGGGQNFWGADYLISYQCHSDHGRYSWSLA